MARFLDLGLSAADAGAVFMNDSSLYNNTTGEANTANGTWALYYNTTGGWNTGIGHGALHHNTTGNYNTGLGLHALLNNETGQNNTGTGYQSLFTNLTGSNNTALGYFADVFTDGLNNATALGANANTLAFTGQGTVELNTSSARTGATLVSAVLLRLNGATALGTPGSASLSSGAVLEINNGSGTFTGTVAAAAGTAIRGGTGTHTFNGIANVNGNMTLNGGPASTDTLILGSDGSDVLRLGAGATTMVGVGTIRLSSANRAGSFSCPMTLWVALVTTIADAKVTRLPPVRFEKPTMLVSPISTWILL